ncbi:MAG: hypothetical protein ICV60_20515 [Pyrinomonadaceae bacterium]|nr:hypothetical protein [Pyrinomonadaceae bacterium]
MRGLKGAATAAALMILLPVAASAYTVILRDGRSVEIPDTFSVTRAGITYEYAKGLYVTIQMTSIDVAATERANREPQGSLLSRAGGRATRLSAAAASTSSPASRAATRTLTDKELEAVRLRREESEKAYERRRLELGLPSLEDVRRQREEETRRLSALAAQKDEEETQAESYWRGRAAELRAAITVNEAEITYIRSRLNQTRGYSSTVAFTSIAPPLSQVPRIFPVSGFPQTPLQFQRPGFARREPIAGRTGGGMARRPVILNPYRGVPRRRNFITPLIPLPFYLPYGFNSSYEQDALAARLGELETERASLQARWRLLEEEARRAGAPPGWLRP